MVLQDIFDQLTHGELHQLFVGGSETEDGIREEDKPRLMAHIQLGLTALHKRFLLKEKRLTINLQDLRNTYVLKDIYSLHNAESNELIKFIDDQEEPLKNDLLKIERVVDDLGNAYTLNDAGDEFTIRTPAYNVLYVPDFDTLDPKCQPTKLHVTYRADHPKIDNILGQYVSFQTEIELPATHLEPLLYFVASRVMNPVGASGEFHEGNNYAAKYEQACQQLEMQGFSLNTQASRDQFDRNGWR